MQATFVAPFNVLDVQQMHTWTKSVSYCIRFCFIHVWPYTLQQHSTFVFYDFYACGICISRLLDPGFAGVALKQKRDEGILCNAEEVASGHRFHHWVIPVFVLQKSGSQSFGFHVLSLTYTIFKAFLHKPAICYSGRNHLE